MTLKSDAKLTCGFKYDMSNLVNFTKPLKSLKVSLRWALFCPKYIRFANNNIRSVILEIKTADVKSLKY